MGLEQCPECRGQVARSAKRCPHCGAKLVGMGNPVVFVLVAGCVAVACWLGWELLRSAG